jgi:opacity protein-like surface antigen
MSFTDGNGPFIKTRQYIILSLLATIILNSCSSIGTPRGGISTFDGLDITARGAVGRMEFAPSGPMYTGDGGANIRLAVLAPEIQGDAPGYLPLYIQGLLNNNINKFSAISLVDRQYLNSLIAEQNLAAGGRFSDKDYIGIGNITNAQYFMFGTIQRLSGDRYSLQLSITESSTGIRKANFMKDGTLTQLEGRGTLLNEATAELLGQLGVQLTDSGRLMLLTGNTSTVQAEAGLARGITAQTGGAEVEALFNFAQAITFDPSQLEALSRLNTLSTNISGGTISERILNDIQTRDRWIEVFKESSRFFNEHPPFEIIFDPSLIKIGETNYAKRTVNLGMRIELNHSEAGFGALNALLEGLEKTGRRKEWGFSGWPLMDISPQTAGTVVFGGKRSFSYKIDVAILNDKGKTLSEKSITLNTKNITFSSGDTQIYPPGTVEGVVSFPNVKADDLTPSLTIVIVSVNGIPARDLAVSGYMRIETGDLEKSVLEREATAQREREAAAAQREREAATQREREAITAQREREAAAKREREAAAQREKEAAAAQREWEAAVAKREKEAAAQLKREAAVQRRREMFGSYLSDNRLGFGVGYVHSFDLDKGATGLTLGFENPLGLNCLSFDILRSDGTRVIETNNDGYSKTVYTFTDTTCIFGTTVGFALFPIFTIYVGGGIGFAIRGDFMLRSSYNGYSDIPDDETTFAWKVNGGLRFLLDPFFVKFDVSYGTIGSAFGIVGGMLF